MTLELARCLEDPDALWEEIEAHGRRGSLLGVAPPQEQPQLTAAVLGARTTRPTAAEQRTEGRDRASHQRTVDGAGSSQQPNATVQASEAWGPALVLGSGGSSGGRRWCLQPLAHLQASAAACGDWLTSQGIDPGRCLHLDALPLHHVSGLMPLLRSRCWDAELRWLPPALLRQPEQLPLACPLPAGRPVLLSLVPTQLHRLLASPEAINWLRQCAVIWLGGAALADDLAARARHAGLPLAPCYGATETAAMVCALPPQRFLAGERGCGPPLSDVELRLAGARGAIAVRCGRLSPGWFEAGRLQPFRDAEGWWRSGDAGGWSGGVSSGQQSNQQSSPAGIQQAAAANRRSLIIHGRLDGAIHSGGDTVFPEQVRQRLLQLIRDQGRPVQELLLLPETDPLWGERLVALVRLQAANPPGQAGTTEAQELAQLAALARALPPSQRPARWLSCPSLAPDESGKWRLAQWRHWLQTQSAEVD